MPNIRVTLSILWVAVMLIFLLGDVLRIIMGHATPGEIQGMKFTQGMGLLIAILMVTPIVMVVLSLVLPHNANRWTNIIMAGFWILFNLVGFGGYPGYYDKFLLAVSMVINGVTIWYAWNWV